MQAKSRQFFLVMSAFWLVFGLGTAFYPRMMQLFMTPEGIAASTAFSDQVWLHGGFDIISVSVLLLALSTVPANANILKLAAAVALLPTAAIIYTLVSTPYWAPLFIVPGVCCAAFSLWGLVLASKAPNTP